MWRVLVLQCVLFQGSLVLALSHKGNDTSEISPSLWSPRSLGQIIAQCLGGQAVWECLGSETERLVDAASRDNSTWQISDYLSIEPQSVQDSSRRMDTGLPGKLLELVQGRALRVKLPRQLTISNAIDDFGSELGLDQGTYTVDDKVDKLIGGWGSFEVLAATPDKDKDKDKKKKKSKKKKKKKDKDKKKKKEKPKKKKKKKKDKYKKKNKNCSKKTGRKKKDKDKNMAMMGGMIMMATLAQMFLGKVILIAGSAFIMAKIALVISLLGSLKKGSTGHSGSGHGGGGTEHVVVHSSHESGWHRSMPTHDYASSQLEQVEEPPPLGGPMEFYQAYQMEPLKRRLHQADSDPQQPRPEATKPTRGFI